jgi:hypothetical protein
MRAIYRNKKTKKVIVTSEKLDKKHWELMQETRGMKKKDTKMKSSKVLKK